MALPLTLFWFDRYLFVRIGCIRVAEHSSELQKEDTEKEIETLKEENRRLREERVRLQAQLQEDQHIYTEMQEQLQQLTKHVKVNLTQTLFDAHIFSDVFSVSLYVTQTENVYFLYLWCLQVIPDLRKEINSLQMQKEEADKNIKAQNQQARGTVFQTQSYCMHYNKFYVMLGVICLFYAL